MLVVIRELENWRHLLKGTKFEQKTSLLSIISVKIQLYLEKNNENQTLIKEQ